MGEGRDGLRLRLETTQCLRVAREVVGKNLDGDVASEARVAGAKDLSHPARAEGGEDLVGALAGAGRQSHTDSFTL